MERSRRTNIFTKLMGLIAVIALTAGVLTGLGLRSMARLQRDLQETVTVSARSVYLATEARRAMLAATRAEAWSILAVDPTVRDELEASIANAEQRMAMAVAEMAGLEDARGQELLRAFTGHWDSWSVIHDRVEQLSGGGARAEAFELASGPGRRAAQTAEQVLTEVVQKADRRMGDVVQEADESYRTARSALLTASVVGLLAAIVISGAMARRIVQNLRVLVHSAEYVARSGDLSRPVQVRGRDEIGELGEAFETMRRSLAESRAELETANAFLEQRVAERTEELTRRNEELDQFAYVASHDLRAPLRGIANLAAWIVEDADELPPEVHGHVEKLQGRVQRMERLLDDLLAYSRADRIRAVPEEIDSGQLVGQVMELLAPPTAFTVKVAADMPRLVAGRAPLELVFRNLIGNALKHHDRSDGCIEIAGREVVGYAEFSVADDGPGIPPQYHERVFQMFQTLKPRDEVEGSGMGLALVRKTVEARGGTVELDSDAGRGTTFRFTWPLHEEDA